jgi:hypothetical protein
MLPKKAKRILRSMADSGESEQITIANFCFDVADSMKDDGPIEILQHLITCLDEIGTNARTTAYQFEMIAKQLDTQIDIDSLQPEDLLELYEKVSKKVIALYQGTI